MSFVADKQVNLALRVELLFVRPESLVRQDQDWRRAPRRAKVANVAGNAAAGVADGNALDLALQPFQDLVVPVFVIRL